MAEIKIEKKSPIWPWILLAIAVIAIIVYFVYDKEDSSIYDNDMNSETRDTISNTYEEGYESTAPYSSTNAVKEFENSVIDSTRLGIDSTYTKMAIVNLAKVVSMKADQLNLQPSIALKNLKYYSDKRDGMTNTELPESSEVINFKTVSKDIVAVLEIIQTKNYPSLQDEVAELKQTSNKIDSNTATKEQQSTIQTFFTKARKVVINMNT